MDRRSLSWVLVLAAVAAVAALAPRPVAGQPTCNAATAVWPLGPSYAVALDGNVALLGRGRELTLVDASNPNAPSPAILGRLTLPGQVRSIARSPTVPGRVAVALDADGVALVDVTNPAAPQLVRHFAVGGRALAVTFGMVNALFFPLDLPKEMLFVARGSKGVQIVEHDAPGGAVLRGSFTLSTPFTSNALDVVAERFDAGGGQFAYRLYVADGGAGVTTLDVGNPDLPTSVSGPLALTGSASAKALLLHRDPTLPTAQADRLFVAAGTGGLRAFNLLNTQPQTQYTFAPASGPFDFEDLAREGMRLFAAASYGGARVIDITDLATMSQVIASGSTAGRVHGAAMRPGGHLYLAGEHAGLLVYQLVEGAPLTFPWRGQLRAAGGAYDAAGTDRWGYVTDFWNGLVVLDLLAPGGPAAVSPPTAFGWQGTAVALAGPLALVGDFAGNLHVVDVSTPAAPAELGAVSVGSAGISSLAVSGSVAYLANSHGNQLAAVSFADPANPALLDTVALGGWADEVAVHGTTVYVTLSGLSQMAVVDASDPTNLVPLGSVPTSTSTSDFAVDGGIGLLAGGSQLQVLSLATPANPTPLGSVALPGLAAGASAVAGVAGWAHAAGTIFDPVVALPVGRLFAVDARTPATPLAVGAVASPSITSVAPAGDRLIAANFELGATLFTDCVHLLRDGFEDGVQLPGRWSAKLGD